MTKLKLIFSILVLITGEASFADYQTVRYNSDTSTFEAITLPGTMPTRLRRQSNDLFSRTYNTTVTPAATTVPRAAGVIQTAALQPSRPTVGRAPPAGAAQDTRGDRAINCRNPQGDFACMACNCYNEAAHRYDDQLAVSKVVMTRVNLKEFPNTVCGVVKQPKQFSWYNSVRTRRSVPANDSCMKASTEALKFRGYFADHYHANYVNPRWRRNMRAVGQVGVHIYYSRFSPADLNRRGGTTTVASL